MMIERGIGKNMALDGRKDRKVRGAMGGEWRERRALYRA
jgi:hypothetical protein